MAIGTGGPSTDDSYLLARDHFYICDKFAHGPTKTDEVCLRGYVSRLVRDETAVSFLDTCIHKKQVEC